MLFRIPNCRVVLQLRRLGFGSGLMEIERRPGIQEVSLHWGLQGWGYTLKP